MDPRYAAIGFLGFLICTISADDALCPLVNCVAGSKVGCFVTQQRCPCSCVNGVDPCEYVIQTFSRNCAPDRVLKCEKEFETCKCRCGRKELPPPGK